MGTLVKIWPLKLSNFRGQISDLERSAKIESIAKYGLGLHLFPNLYFTLLEGEAAEVEFLEALDMLNHFTEAKSKKTENRKKKLFVKLYC